MGLDSLLQEIVVDVYLEWPGDQDLGVDQKGEMRMG